MIKFIICDNDIDFSKKIENIINQFMFHNSLDYKIIKQFIKEDEIDLKNSNKIYILDIDAYEEKAIQKTKQIRKKDLKSPIIFISNSYQFLEKIMRNTILLFDFILKEELEKKFYNTLKQALKYIDVQDLLCIKQNGITYRISKNSILYIMTNPEKAGSIIVTDHMKYKTKLSLVNLKKELDHSFIQSHRSCIINSNRVLSIDFKNRILEFDNGEKIDLISFRLKSSLKDIL